jgi:hypothetical protein
MLLMLTDVFVNFDHDADKIVVSSITHAGPISAGRWLLVPDKNQRWGGREGTSANRGNTANFGSLVYNPSFPALFSRNKFPSRIYRRTI